ncbi:GlxA family transcriptional regulator [Sphingobacterium siyangense]|uniref:GlxA family transcriptional regulator n=1 Tax=Sphingobacterium siyangense TaxID=459529 RepID=UPI0019195434|nr:MULTISPECIES: helix-turn-helix domain-containing protein [Sphingobacterium]QQT33210.1 helix-turn-helix domain-containing protein [Sphingobacterium multivorum]QRY56086.1 helix-turn-helix domain-containing protein [Sphingobacterium siyangense]
MKHLTILVPDSQTGPNTISCIVGTYHVFTEANRYYDQLNREPIFNIELAGVSKQSNFVNGLLTVMTQKDIATIQKTDLIIVPAVISNFSAIEDGNNMLSAWILDHYTKGANVASMCTGAYLLASTGLLDNKNCSIHWKSAANFHKLFPKVNLKTEQIITDEQGIYTNGGGYSFLNLLLYLVEKFYDRQTAIYCSKIFQIDIARQTQSDFMIFNGQKSHGDEMVMRAQDYLENNFSEKISMGKLSEKFTVGRRNFDRRFIKATGNTPVEYLQRIKVESAKKELESSRKTINEVMYAIGYTDIKAFREIFRRFTGLSPLEYKNKYNKAAIK